jgi:hypothetical protein
MLLLVFMAIYFGLCIKKLVTGEDNIRLSVLQINDLEQSGQVSYADTNVVFFAIIRNDKPGAPTPFINGSGNFS